MSACSERCGYCGRCTTRMRPRADRATLTHEDHEWISRAWAQAGIGRDYLGFEDRLYLRQQGKSVDEIIDFGLEMADRDKRLQQAK